MLKNTTPKSSTTRTPKEYINRGIVFILSPILLFVVWIIFWVIIFPNLSNSFGSFFLISILVFFILMLIGIIIGLQSIMHTHFLDRWYTMSGYEYSWPQYMFWAKFKRKIYSVDGKKIIVNITNQACEPFGFYFCDRMVTPNGDTGMIMGVAKENDDKASSVGMWYILDKDGKARYQKGPDLKKAGFTIGTL